MLKILTTKPSADYELIDSGDGEKLERFGTYILRRPDPQALWKKNLAEKLWKQADASFSRDSDNAKWRMKDGSTSSPRVAMAKEWEINFAGFKFIIKPTAFKHTGLFPEQEQNWALIKEKISPRTDLGEVVKVLNLFGYTGGATLAALSAGAEVTHVDGSKSAITWAKQNTELSGLAGGKVRWIEDDARKFVQREIKRGNKYEAIIMDPPAFGHGANNEVWKIEEDFISFLDLCSEILSDKPLFILINGYSAGYSAVAYENSLLPFAKKFGGSIESGELTIEEAKTGRLLPAGIFSRWS
jgi:23S rRNA (cytosine1962-C5)-methyltransferase